MNFWMSSHFMVFGHGLPLLCGGSVVYAASQTALAPISSFIRMKPYYFILFGLIAVLVLSRTFGSGQIWRRIDVQGDYRLSRNIVQEGLELFGYLFISYGAFLFRRCRGFDDLIL